jgi:ATP-dependent Clp protease, protease subunit
LKRFKNEKMNEEATKIEHKFKAETKTDVSEIHIYGDIGESWLWDSVSANDVKDALKEIEGDVVIRINSPGGDAFDGIAIYNQLKNHNGKITVYVDGWAASAASIIAMAADELIMNTGTMLMVHEAWTFAYGNKTDIEKTVNALKGLDASLADIYMTRFKGERSEIETFMKNETWFTASEAVEVGLADKVNESAEELEVANKMDSEEFKNSILQRFRQNQEPAAANANKNILNNFKRQS